MDECSKIIILDGEHSIPQGNLNKKLSALKNGGFQGKESHCSEIVGPQTGGVVSLNLFQPLIETEGGRRGRRLAHQPWLWGINICRSGFYLGFVLPLRGGEASNRNISQLHGLSCGFSPCSLHTPPKATSSPLLPCPTFPQLSSH